MKKIYLIAVILIITANTEAQIQLNIFGGPQTTTALYKVNDSKQKTSQKFGFQAGMGLKIPFENKIFFAPVAFYSLKGYKVQLDSRVFPPDPEALENNVTMHTFEAAALIQFDLGTKQDHYFISFGPSLDIQIKGKEKYRLMTGESINKDMRFSYGDYGRYSIAAIGRFGYEFNNELMIFVQYNMGLGSINNADNGPSILHRVFGISIARVLH